MSKPKRREYYLNTMEEFISSPVGDDPIEMLMAAVGQAAPDHLSDGVSAAIQSALDSLGEKDRWVLDAIYIWGHSY